MRNAYELISAGDIAGAGELVADSFIEHEGGPGFPPTKEGALDFFRALREAFPDMSMIVEDVLADGDKTVARVRMIGTHEGSFMGIVPTGATVDVQLIDIMRFDAAGRVCEHWGVTDMLTLMQQLGVVPAGAPA
jgi:predicted ester cyclase